MPDTPTQPPDPIAELKRKIAQRELLLQDSPDDDLLLASLAKLKEQLNQINASTISATNVVSGVQLNDNRTTNIFEAPKPPPTEDLEARYLRGLRKRLTRLPLGDSDDDAQGVTLESVYIALDTTERIELTEAEKPSDVPMDRAVTCQEAIAQNKRVVLLGDPGSGKSSFVNQLAAALALARLDEKQAKPTQPPAGLRANGLPLVMTLRDLVPRLPTLPENCDPATQAQLLRAAVWAQWDEELAKDKAAGFRSALENKLEAGEAVLIFDGLDEVAEAARSRVRDAVRALLYEYPNISHVVITCRTRSYSDSLFSNYKKYEVAKFDAGKIRQFVQQWYAARTDAGDGRLKAKELTEAVLEPSLRELAKNPMLLTTMALLHSRDQGRLPKERAKLYDRAINLLLERWQKKGIAVSPALKSVLADTAKLREMARELAHQAHTLQQKQKDADLERGFLLALLEQPRFLGADGPVREFLDYVDQRSGLLIGLGGDVDGDGSGGQPKTYKFPHRTFQEYLAGCWLVAQRPRDTLTRYERSAQADDYWTLAAQLGAEDLLHNHDRKTDVADLAYKLLRENPNNAKDWRCTLWSAKLAVLLGKDAVLADTDPFGGPAFLRRLLPQLHTLLTENKLPAIERADTGRAIGKLADPADPLFAYAFDVDEIYKNLCTVPAGTFWMGSAADDKNAYGRERPRHEQTVTAFRMAHFPITNAQYAAFVAAGGEPAEDYGEPFNLPNHPVVGVSWRQAVAFCAWLTQRWQDTQLITKNEAVRLPNEAEWERAARGNLESAQYAWGDDADTEKMNFANTRIGSTSAVGCFSLGRNAFRLEDMSGTVWEWCSTKWQDNYKDYADDNAPDGDARRVLRGGSWVYDLQLARVACRDFNAPGGRSNYLGFRVVCAPVLPPPASGNLNSESLGS